MKREEGLFMRGKGREKERHLNVSGPASLFAASFLEKDSFKSLWSRETETRQHSSQDRVFLICDEMSFSGLNIRLTCARSLDWVKRFTCPR